MHFFNHKIAWKVRGVYYRSSYSVGLFQIEQSFENGKITEYPNTGGAALV